MSRVYVIIFIMLAFCGDLFAQYSEDDYSNKGFLNQYWNDIKSISTNSLSPQHYPDWKLLTYAGLTSIFILSHDMEFHEEYGLEKQYGRFSLPKSLAEIGNFYDKPGTLYFTAGLAGAMYGSGKLFNDQKLVQTTHLMVKSLIITGIFTTGLKVLIGRARPYTADNPHKFKPFNFKFNTDYMSMPSGHTSSIFAMMTVIAKQYDSWYVKLPAYTFAVSVAFQRMNSRKHWGSDLIIGGTLGYLIGSAIVNKYGKNSYGYRLQPAVSSNGVGFTLNF